MSGTRRRSRLLFDESGVPPGRPGSRVVPAVFYGLCLCFVVASVVWLFIHLAKGEYRLALYDAPFFLLLVWLLYNRRESMARVWRARHQRNGPGPDGT